MKVEFEFDQSRIRELGYRPEQVTAKLKQIFQERGLRCVSDRGTIAFADNDSPHDFANVWIGITGLINSNWFLECATACRFFDDSEEAAAGAYEDVLSQAVLLMKEG